MLECIYFGKTNRIMSTDEIYWCKACGSLIYDSKGVVGEDEMNIQGRDFP